MSKYGIVSEKGRLLGYAECSDLTQVIKFIDITGAESPQYSKKIQTEKDLNDFLTDARVVTEKSLIKFFPGLNVTEILSKLHSQGRVDTWLVEGRHSMIRIYGATSPSERKRFTLSKTQERISEKRASVDEFLAEKE